MGWDSKAEKQARIYFSGDFPGGLVVKTLCFYCMGHGFDPWLGN